MRDTQLLMGMPITVDVVDSEEASRLIDEVFSYFTHIDETFSTYKPESEISEINYRNLPPEKWSAEMKEIFALSEKTKQETGGYFDIRTKSGVYDPSGIVKGYAIWKAAHDLEKKGAVNFFIDAGGDIQTRGKNEGGEAWSIGIRDPFDRESKKIVKIIYAPSSGLGIATSGTYLRGQHIYDPHNPEKRLADIVSLTVIGQNIYDADRFATAAFAMGKTGIEFIEQLAGFEGYSIDSTGIATETQGFSRYTEEYFEKNKKVTTA